MRDEIIGQDYQDSKAIAGYDDGVTPFCDGTTDAVAYQERMRQADVERGFVDSAWKDTIVGRMRYFEGDGSVNFYGYPLAVRKRMDEIRALPRAKRGESENVEQSRHASAKRARKNVRLRCQEIQADRLLTLTYRENMQDIERLKADFKAFMRAMKRAGMYHYVAVPEPQKRGAWHIHVAVHGRLVYNLVRAVWRRVVGLDEQGRPNGNVDVRNPKTGGKWKRHALAAYIAKYVTKEFDAHELNKKRYWSSKGIVVPEPVTYFVQDSNDMHAVIVDAMKAAMEVCPAYEIQAYVSDGGRYFFVGASPSVN
ncbi:rolling circle replication-associated protein [Cupriavidus plantarum]|uniref:rolling circle replication-associated protein n=1 Tax=Cupriavidus plantarum TaxID=942865 RepID=UPI001B2B3E93|nr:hypothetical protein [Cupriavidus plantarum]CAG2142986.1 hypothetical protein LMG26296_03327 [Cupriavidus plantarum]SMR65621.1 hypothetical protein SAMN05421735_0471 [Cupriavidus plantarum]